jgi:MFS family permease
MSDSIGEERQSPLIAPDAAHTQGLPEGAAPAHGRWLNRRILGLGLASLFSDMNHEMATAILPLFLVITLHASPAALGFVEGTADALASFVKLASGWWTDRAGQRKPLAVIGYIMTGISKPLYAVAQSWPQLLAFRSFGWIGRGIRTPAREAMLVDASEPWAYGRVFGFHRMMDTLGAISGPAIALGLLAALTYRQIFLVTIIPGILAPLSIILLVRERRRTPDRSLHFRAQLAALPTSFRWFLVAVGLFGLGNFAPTLLILRVNEQLTPSYGVATAGFIAVALYTAHNIVFAGASYPVGVLSERFGKRLLLGVGYACFAAMAIGFALAPHGTTGLIVLAVLFVGGGIYIALVEAMEGALAADLLPAPQRGTGYGALATVNGIGDFASSIVVGVLWTAVAPAAGFAYAATLSVLGAIMLWWTRHPVHAQQ